MTVDFKNINSFQILTVSLALLLGILLFTALFLPEDNSSKQTSKQTRAPNKQENHRKKATPKDNQQTNNIQSDKKQQSSPREEERNSRKDIHTIRVNVQNGKNQPIKNAIVTAKVLSNSSQIFLGHNSSGRTNEDGNIEIEISKNSSKFQELLNREDARLRIFSRKEGYFWPTEETNSDFYALDNLPEEIQLTLRRGRKFKPTKIKGVSENYVSVFNKTYYAELLMPNSDKSVQLKITNTDGNLKIKPIASPRVPSGKLVLLVSPYGRNHPVSSDYKYRRKKVEIPAGEAGDVIDLGAINMERNPDYTESVKLSFTLEYDEKKREKHGNLIKKLHVYSYRLNKFILHESIHYQKKVFDLHAEGSFLIYLRMETEDAKTGWYWKKETTANRGDHLTYNVEEPKKSGTVYIRKFNNQNNEYVRPGSDGWFKFFLQPKGKKKIQLRGLKVKNTTYQNGPALVTTFDPVLKTFSHRLTDRMNEEEKLEGRTIERTLDYAPGKTKEVTIDFYK